jgi:hypothetical protein
VHETLVSRVASEGKMSPQICVNMLLDSGGNCRRCYHFCYQFYYRFRISYSLQNTWRRGESNPCFLRLRPLRSRKGFIREDSGRIRGHGNAWMALDVITIVIRWPALGDIRNRSIGQLVSTLGKSAKRCSKTRLALRSPGCLLKNLGSFPFRAQPSWSVWKRI